MSDVRLPITEVCYTTMAPTEELRADSIEPSLTFSSDFQINRCLMNQETKKKTSLLNTKLKDLDQSINQTEIVAKVSLKRRTSLFKFQSKNPDKMYIFIFDQELLQVQVQWNELMRQTLAKF